MTRALRQRLGLGDHDSIPVPDPADRTIMARALMYLLAAAGTVIVASVAIPDAPLAHADQVVVLAGIAYAAAIGVMIGFDRLPTWGFHVFLLAGTAMISWAIHASEDAGSPYEIFYFWIAIYAAFFFGPRGTALHVLAIAATYGGVLIDLQDQARTPALHWAMTVAAVVMASALVQMLNARITRLIERLTDVGRADSLTGLLNASGFAELMENELERANRSSTRLAVVLAEVDGFNPVAGGGLSRDQQRALSSVGEAFLNGPRQIDRAARLGGGRFAVVLPYTDEHGAYVMAERMRGMAHDIAIPSGAPVRLSLGISSFPRHGTTEQQVMQAAENALAEAQTAGGDRVVVHQRSGSSVEVRVSVETEQ